MSATHTGRWMLHAVIRIADKVIRPIRPQQERGRAERQGVDAVRLAADSDGLAGLELPVLHPFPDIDPHLDEVRKLQAALQEDALMAA